MDFDGAGRGVAGLVTAVLGVTIIAVVLSSKANSVNVLNSFFGGLSNLVKVAVSPVTGGGVVAASSGGGLAPTIVPNSNGGYSPQGSVAGQAAAGGAAGLANWALGQFGQTGGSSSTPSGYANVDGGMMVNLSNGGGIDSGSWGQ